MTEETVHIITGLTVLAHTFNSVIDAGDHEGITVDEVQALIEEGTIFQFLEERYPFVKNWGLSLFRGEDRERLLDEWQRCANAIDADRKMGVRNNGICLCLAYALEGINLRADARQQNPWP